MHFKTTTLFDKQAKKLGKSAGYRVYYYIQLEETTQLLTIYDKSEIEMIDEELLKDLIEELQGGFPIHR